MELEDDKDMFSQTDDDVFPAKYKLCTEESACIGSNKSYVLHLALNSNGSRLAVGLSDSRLVILDAATLSQVQSIQTRSKNLSAVVSSPRNEHLVYTSSPGDGCVKLWDLRDAREPAKSYTDTSHLDSSGRAEKKSVISLDVNRDDRFVAAGTEQVVLDAFLLFWDTRSDKMLGGYWDSYGDSVTAVKFDPDASDRLATGGADGLINVFDISQECEDDALVTSLNAGTPLKRLTWCRKRKTGKNSICAATADEEVVLWQNVDGVEPHKTFSRQEVTIAMRRKSDGWCYVVDSHYRSDAQQTLLVVSGSSFSTDPCLRISCVKKNRLKPYADLPQPDAGRGGGSVVRASAFNSFSGGLYTGRENGTVQFWTPQ